MTTSNKSSTNDKKKYYKKTVTFSVILSTEDTNVLKNDELLKQLAYLNNYGHIDRILLDIGVSKNTEKAIPNTISLKPQIKDEFTSNIKINLDDIPVGNKYVFLTDDIRRLDNNKFKSIKDKKNIVPIICKTNKIVEMVKFLQRLRFENVILENKSRERNVYLHVNMDKPEGKKFNNLHKNQKSSKVLGRIKRYMKTKLGKLSMNKGYYGLGEELVALDNNKTKLTINIGLEHDSNFNVNIHINNNNCKFVEHLILGEPEGKLPSRVVNYLEGERKSKPTGKHTAKVKREDRSEQSTRRRRTIKKKNIKKVELNKNTAATNSFKEYGKDLKALDGDGRLKNYSILKQKLSYLNMKKDELNQDIINVEEKLTKLENNMPESIVHNLQKFIKKGELSASDKQKLKNLNNLNSNSLTKKEIEALRIQVQKYEATPKQKDIRKKKSEQKNLENKVKKQLSELGKTKKKGLLTRIAGRFKRTNTQGKK